MTIKEDLLQFIWNYSLFEAGSLKSQKGEKIQIVNTGIQNFQDGPDFLHARIHIADQLYSGHVELHIWPKDWYSHNHHKDPEYCKVILHVSMFEEDISILDSMQRKIPQLFLQPYINKNLLFKYRQIKESLHWIPCEKLISPYTDQIGSFYAEWLNERLIGKAEVIKRINSLSGGNWDITLQRYLVQSFGLKSNKEGFRLLSELLDVKMIEAYSDDLETVEAIIFGQAGMLKSGSKDIYREKLYKKYTSLSEISELEFLPATIWNFSRIRPVNFPTVRLAQLAGLLSGSIDLLAFVLEAKNVQELADILNTPASAYWDTHFTFGKKSSVHIKTTGGKFLESIIINGIIPFLFYYGSFMQRPELTERSLNLLKQCKPEVNSIVSKWRSLGVSANNAGDTQALLQLKTHYCERYKCLDCELGKLIVKKA